LTTAEAQAATTDPVGGHKVMRVLCFGELPEEGLPLPVEGERLAFNFELYLSGSRGSPSRESLQGYDLLLLFLATNHCDSVRQFGLPDGVTRDFPIVVVAPTFAPLFAVQLLRWGVEEVIPGSEYNSSRLQYALLAALVRFKRNRQSTQRSKGVAAAVEQKALQALDGLPFGVMLADRDSRVMFMNASARQICAGEGGLYISSDKICCVHDQDDNAALHRLIREVSDEEESQQEGNYMLQITAGDGGRLTLLAVPVGSQAEQHGVALFLDGGGGFFKISAEAIKRVYSLTDSETELLLKLVQGDTLAEIAKHRDVTIHTVRAQLKSVFTKTGTQRQAGLIKKVLTGPAALMQR
jgi:DNA-binding CsgD family transcriptional regulator